MAAYDLANWYESGLAPAERKTRGHFSTPPPLVERILDACSFSPERNLTQLRVLDPACGSGNFLTAVLHRMLLSSKGSDLSQRQILARVSQNLWGFDPDPISCFMAEMHARELLAVHGLSSSPRSPAPRLHIHQADALTFPWSQAMDEKRHAGVDLFLANPPYLAAKNADLSAYRTIYQRQGQSDSYLLFLDLAIRAVRPGGWLGLVLPDPLLARANATPERQLLLRETTIYQLWHLSSVFSAFVGAVVIVAQKRLPKRLHQVAWTRGPWPGTSNPEELLSLNPSIKNSGVFVFSSPRAVISHRECWPASQRPSYVTCLIAREDLWWSVYIVRGNARRGGVDRLLLHSRIGSCSGVERSCARKATYLWIHLLTRAYGIRCFAGALMFLRIAHQDQCVGLSIVPCGNRWSVIACPSC
ncbi:HsdM family class I SAM-dependent methyltransferase [Ktedonospora formicarum]|uniref:DNA methylase adenine-specific domain-containing protein n=1 Tax=Ktedonospora formicarum TaxID=2778364 RepID=A0A8J3HUH0_9CHLR|nr:N-6 DNA methylase [Ktedonospora formicarum]GHO43506.1 hypothetical protein KSX_16690 [Ktedonospora formicarum]